ncbi:MAG: hypothetical protein ABFD77_06600 [Thermotogota bacterium]
MRQKDKKMEGPFVVLELAVLLALVLFALWTPMRHGARLWEAIAVLPQMVLWFVPILFALPVVLFLANRLRPERAPRATPRLKDASANTLAFLADAVRASRSSHLARSRVTTQLLRLAVRIEAHRSELPEEDAWTLFRQRCRELEPDLARFLAREDLSALSGTEFQSWIRRTVAFLERESEEA